jgi:hypothetical protein
MAFNPKFDRAKSELDDVPVPRRILDKQILINEIAAWEHDSALRFDFNSVDQIFVSK